MPKRFGCFRDRGLPHGVQREILGVETMVHNRVDHCTFYDCHHHVDCSCLLLELPPLRSSYYGSVLVYNPCYKYRDFEY